ncbi:hypothetical protein, partial [Salmonella enterica]
RCFNKSKGVLITGLKLKAFRNPQPSWGFSIDKKEGSGTPFVNMSEYDILVLFYLLSGRKSYAVGRYLQST